jgi:hypothetical protein
MNNTFNIQRFSRLFNKYTKENFKTNTMAIAVITGIMLIAFGFIAYTNRGYVSVKVQTVFFQFFLIFAGAIYTSIVFSDLGDKKTAIPALTIPVSHFERFLVGWLYSYIIFQVIFLACFYAVDVAVLKIGDSTAGVKNEVMDLFSATLKPYIAFPVYAVIHACMFLGAVFFEKLHFIKSACVVLAFATIVMLVNQPVASLIFNLSMDMVPPFVGVRFHIGSEIIFIGADDPANNVVYVMCTAVILLLWTATYFRLKEKQV